MQGVTIWSPDWTAGAEGPARRRRALEATRPEAEMTSAVLGESAIARVAAQPLAADADRSGFDGSPSPIVATIAPEAAQPRHRGGRDRGDDRPFGLGQDHRPERGRRLRSAGYRAHSDRGRRCDRPAALRTRLAMVVQNYALFPHMRVKDNVAFGLKARGAAKSLIEERVADAPRIVGMRRSSSATRANCPAASSSAWRSPGRSPCVRACSCSTSRSRRSTRRFADRWSRRSPAFMPICRG